MFNRGFFSSMLRNFVGLTAVGGLTLGAVAPCAGDAGHCRSPPEPAGNREFVAAVAWDYV